MSADPVDELVARCQNQVIPIVLHQSWLGQQKDSFGDLRDGFNEDHYQQGLHKLDENVELAHLKPGVDDLDEQC